MGHKTLVYQKKVRDNLEESYTHLKRLEIACDELAKRYSFPLSFEDYTLLVEDIQDLAFSDQIIYRFAKLQDSMGAKLFKSLLLYQGENVDKPYSMGAKLFKSLLLYQGENVDKPFLDILNQLEKMDIIDVEEWFEIRDLRNEISHDYENNEQKAIEILNMIVELKDDLHKILTTIKNLVNKHK